MGRMQAIAAEFNLSETVFVRPAANPDPIRRRSGSSRRRAKLPFAGHPTVGTAVLLGLERAAGGMGTMARWSCVLEEALGAGTLRRERPWRSRSATGVFDLPKLPVEAAEPGTGQGMPSPLHWRSCPSRSAWRITSRRASMPASPIAFVPVRDRAAIARAAVNPGRVAAPPSGKVGAFLYCRETAEQRPTTSTAACSRRRIGIAEDPATGSAVAALAGVIARFDQPPGRPAIATTVEQGYEMGRSPA
jgi:trans-2,3-dihydro-3-hydroxyanthranilate isomerase